MKLLKRKVNPTYFPDNTLPKLIKKSNIGNSKSIPYSATYSITINQRLKIKMKDSAEF